MYNRNASRSKMPVSSANRQKRTHQEAFEIVPGVAARLQRVVEVVHDPHGFEIDRVLVLEVVLLIARYEREIADTMVQLVERKRNPVPALNGFFSGSSGSRSRRLIRSKSETIR